MPPLARSKRGREQRLESPAKLARTNRRSFASTHESGASSLTSLPSESSGVLDTANALSPRCFREAFLPTNDPLLHYVPKLVNGTKTLRADGDSGSVTNGEATTGPLTDIVDTNASRRRLEPDTQCYELTLTHVSELSDPDFVSCFSLIEETSAADYAAASHGWQPAAKKLEMRDPAMWYLLVRQASLRASITSVPTKAPLTGFLSFMLTPEPPYAVLYIYELHLAAAARGAGLGARLLRVAHAVSARVGLHKTMLTVFTRNERAEQFYRRRGYDEDEISPRAVVRRLRRGRIAMERPEYIILCRWKADEDGDA